MNSDDLLNYELGEDFDDHAAILAADEDELLLSDEELERVVSKEQKALLKDEAEKWVCSKLKPTKHKNTVDEGKKKTDDVVTTSSNDGPESERRSTNLEYATNAESDVSTSVECPVKLVSIKEKEITVPIIKETVTEPQTINDEVTSTNKEVEEQGIQQQVVSSKQPVYVAAKNVLGNEKRHKEEFFESTQEGVDTVEEILVDPREEGEERAERTNIKQIVERDDQNDSSPEKFPTGRFFPSKRGRGGMPLRGGHFSGPRPPVRYPHINYPHYLHPNENNNPQGPSQFSPYPPMDPQMNARQPFPGNMGPRMEYRPPMGPNFRPQNPNDFNLYRGPRPDYPNHMNGGPMFNAFGHPNQMRPMFRPDGSGNSMQMPPRFDIRPRMPMPRPTGISQQNPNTNFNAIQHQHTSSSSGQQQHPGNMTIIPHTSLPGQPSTGQVIPRKVLINPNFKGGVEAATSQLMKDTQFMQAISSHVTHLQSDDELLRQQEEFINKNRIHIEKRRHERSPERNRSRERSYSPPRRGERRPDSREHRPVSPRNRGRRGGSREFDNRNFPKRRRSGSFERRREKDKAEEEEDAETRAYRLEIEKQKAMREKILKDKEMRRRRAAEGKVIDEKPNTDEPPQKLKPIIVTESKIISLKKKGGGGGGSGGDNSGGGYNSGGNDVVTKSKLSKSSTQQHHQQTNQRAIPTAKILPETKRKSNEFLGNVKDLTNQQTTTATLAVIKPVMKKTITVQTDISKADLMDDDELLEEDLLLADTPSPPQSPSTSPPPPPLPSSKNFPEKLTKTKSNDDIIKHSGGGGGGSGNIFTSSNRRVVLKSREQQKHQKDLQQTIENSKKGIFDRLEKKIGVNESVKRKIQRIVIKNAE